MRYEYYVITYLAMADHACGLFLNEKGEQGWKLIDVHDGRFFFVRKRKDYPRDAMPPSESDRPSDRPSSEKLLS